jgi:dipeptidyl aminopeptidase/acylaminoacyl peptidase
MPRLLFVSLLIAVSAAAQEPARDHNITLDDYATLAAITELAVSPDGKHVAYCEGRWDKADDLRKTDLWVVSTDGKGKPTRLTSDRANDRHPKWSADGKVIYVLGNRKREAEKNPPYDGKTQVWRVPIDGGDPRAVTKVEGGVTGFDYSPKADVFFYSVDTSTTDKDEFSDLRSKFKADYGHGTRKVSEIHRLDLQSWRAEKIIGEGRYIREFAVTQDGKRVAMVSCIDDTVIKSEGESRVDIWEGGEVVTPSTDAYREKAASPHAWLESLAWSQDGKNLAFCTIFDAYPTEVILQVQQKAGWVSKRLGRIHGLHIRGYGSPLKFKWFSEQNDLLACIGEKDGSIFQALCEVKKDVPIYGGPGNPDSKFGMALAVDYGGLEQGVALMSSATAFPDFFDCSVGHADRDPRHLTRVNPDSVRWRIPSIKHITWKAPDGSEVGGVLELPPDYKKGDMLPLVVGIHGGPTTSTKAELSYDPHNGRLYFAAHGYAALFPNYRGSTGYGDKFVTDLIGRENDIEVKDIVAGVQHLIKEGIADPERIGVMGWSNGGYLTNCLITMKDPPVKFKAASTGAGILETTSQWGMNDEPAYMQVFKKGLPWEVSEAYRNASPLYGIGNVTTPTLIHVGANDERCPPGQSRMLYRALKEYKKVPTELIVYPGEPHGLSKLSNRKAKMEWDLAWFDRYVKGKK